jgi:hypothetical protein
LRSGRAAQAAAGEGLDEPELDELLPDELEPEPELLELEELPEAEEDDEDEEPSDFEPPEPPPDSGFAADGALEPDELLRLSVR